MSHSLRIYPEYQARMGDVLFLHPLVQKSRRCWNRHSPKAQFFSSLKVKLAVKEIIDLINGSFTLLSFSYLICFFTILLYLVSALLVTILATRVRARKSDLTNRTVSFFCWQRIYLSNLIAFWT